jgi:hypothetical protein
MNVGNLQKFDPQVAGPIICMHFSTSAAWKSNLSNFPTSNFSYSTDLDGQHYQLSEKHNFGWDQLTRFWAILTFWHTFAVQTRALKCYVCNESSYVQFDPRKRIKLRNLTKDPYDTSKRWQRNVILTFGVIRQEWPSCSWATVDHMWDHRASKFGPEQS